MPGEESERVCTGRDVGGKAKGVCGDAWRGNSSGKKAGVFYSRFMCGRVESLMVMARVKR